MTSQVNERDEQLRDHLTKLGSHIASVTGHLIGSNARWAADAWDISVDTSLAHLPELLGDDVMGEIRSAWEQFKKLAVLLDMQDRLNPTGG